MSASETQGFRGYHSLHGSKELPVDKEGGGRVGFCQSRKGEGKSKGLHHAAFWRRSFRRTIGKECVVTHMPQEIASFSKTT